MKQQQLFVLLIALCLVFPVSVQAQWKSKVSLGGSYYSGNVNKLDIRSTGGISKASEAFELSSSYKVIYSEANDVQNNQEISGGVKFDYKPKNKFSPFLAVNLYNNEYKGYALRVSSIVGAKYVLLKNDKASHSISAALQYDAEQYTANDEGVIKDPKNLLRLSVRPKLKQKLTESVSISHVTYYRPYLNDFGDYQVDSKTSLSNKLSTKIYLDLSYELKYESKPVKEDAKNADNAVIVSLVFKL